MPPVSNPVTPEDVAKRLRALREIAHVAWHLLSSGCDGEEMTVDRSEFERLDAAMDAYAGEGDDVHFALEELDEAAYLLAALDRPPVA